MNVFSEMNHRFTRSDGNLPLDDEETMKYE